jgi:hypothetical protein
MSKKQSSQRSKAQKLFYTEVFKQNVNEVLSGKLTQQQAQMIYDIRGNSTILNWIRQSKGLKGYEKKPLQPANFADNRQQIFNKSQPGLDINN